MIAAGRWALAASLILASADALADGWTGATTFTSGPDMRFWTGQTPTGVSGSQIVTNYGVNFKYTSKDQFDFTTGVQSGYLDTQAKQIIPLGFFNGRPLGVAGYQNYQASGSLDALSFARLDLKTNKTFQPYIWVGYNYSPNATMGGAQVFAFAPDGDRDLRSAFGAGSYFETRAGTKYVINRDNAFDFGWKHNYGTRFSAYDYVVSVQDIAASNSGYARYQHSSDKFDYSFGYERTWFGESTMTYQDINTSLFHENWIYGALNIINGKTEYRIDKNWFVFGEGSVSWQEKDKYGKDADPAVQSYNAHPFKYSGLFGLGYLMDKWTYQIQGIYSADNRNGAVAPTIPVPTSDYLPGRRRKGIEGLVNYNYSKALSLDFRLSRIEVSGTEDPGPGMEFPLYYAPAQITTVYFSGKLKF